MTAGSVSAFEGGRRGATYLLGALSVVAFFNFLDRAIFSVLAVPIKADLRLSDTEIGLLGGLAFALFYAFLGLPLARLADRSNRTRLVSVCLAVWSASTAACGMAGGFVSLLLARIGVGAGEAGCFPASYSMLSDAYPPKRRAYAIGIFHTVGNVGFLAGLMAAGLLAEAVGWRMAFAIVGIPGILFALWTAVALPEPARLLGEAAPTKSEATSLWAVLRHVASRPALRNLTIGYSLSIFAFYSALAWLPHLFARAHGLSNAEIGLWYGLAFGGGMIGGVLIGALVSPAAVAKDRRWEMWLPGTGVLIACPFFILAFWTPSTGIALAATALGSAAASSGLGPGFSAVQALAPPDARATTAAAVLLISAVVGQGFGPAIVGFVSDALAQRHVSASLEISLSLAGVGFLWASVHYLIGSRTFRRESSDHEASGEKHAH